MDPLWKTVFSAPIADEFNMAEMSRVLVQGNSAGSVRGRVDRPSSGEKRPLQRSQEMRKDASVFKRATSARREEPKDETMFQGSGEVASVRAR